jgi:hypothetical protein
MKFYIQYKNALGDWVDLGNYFTDYNMALWSVENNAHSYVEVRLVERIDRELILIRYGKEVN